MTEQDPRPLNPSVTVIPAVRTIHKAERDRPLRVAGYCRVSTDSHDQKNSFEAQVQYFSRIISENPKWSLVNIYPDRGTTGTQIKCRTQFKKMIRDCQKGKIDLILTKSVSRFARNTVDCLDTVRMLKALGVGVYFEEQKINTLAESSELYLTIYSCMAQQESEAISGNVLWGIQRAMQSGKASVRIYGYRTLSDGQAEVIPEEAAVIRWIYDCYLSGDSIQTLRDKLEAKGVPSPKGKTVWAHSTLEYLLQNEKYCGDALRGKTFTKDCITHQVARNNGERAKYYIKNHHTAILDRDTFQRVQEERARRIGSSREKIQKKGLQQVKYSSKYALTDLMICGECGAAYQRVTPRNRLGEVIPKWRCISRVRFGSRYCHNSPTIEESRIQEAVLEAINTMMSGKDALLQTLRGISREALCGETAEFDVYGARKRIKKLQAQVMELVAASARVGSIGDYEAEMARMSDEIQELEAKIQAHKDNQEEQARLEQRTHALADALKNAPFEITSYHDSVVRQLIETIHIVNAGRLRVVFRGGGEVLVDLPGEAAKRGRRRKNAA